MFTRVNFEQWHEIIPYVALGLFVTAFVIIVIRTLSIKRPEIDRLSHLPLDKEEPKINQAKK